jgi:hypothetical protein
MCDFILRLESVLLRKYENYDTRKWLWPSEYVYTYFLSFMDNICNLLQDFLFAWLISVIVMLGVSEVRHCLWSIKINSKNLIHLCYWDTSHGSQ